MSRAGYRTLLEAGIRVFEWNGPMLHAKTAVADGRWARVGSTNLNLASWMGNRAGAASSRRRPAAAVAEDRPIIISGEPAPETLRPSQGERRGQRRRHDESAASLACVWNDVS